MNYPSDGLVLFLIVLVLNLLGVLLDVVLLAQGLPTISQTVWDHPALACPILFWQALGLVGLAVHLWAPPQPPGP
jgi:hypothetical protein